MWRTCKRIKSTNYLPESTWKSVIVQLNICFGIIPGSQKQALKNSQFPTTCYIDSLRSNYVGASAWQTPFVYFHMQTEVYIEV